MLASALEAERFTEEEVQSAVRACGVASFDLVEAVVLETNGSLSVIVRLDRESPRSALEGVRGFPDAA